MICHSLPGNLFIKIQINDFYNYMENKYISLALEEAKIAYDLNEVPVGAVIVYDGKIIAK